MSEKSVPIEIEMRGSVLKLSITIESVLMSIVYFSNSEQYSKRKAETLRLKNCMFGQKIERVKKVLSEFHPDILTVYSNLFQDIEDFKPLRNRMSHCGITFGNSLSKFQVWDISEDENNFQFYAPFEYTVRGIYQTLDKTIKDIIPPLTNLLNEVEIRLKKKAPQIYELLKKEDNSL